MWRIIATYDLECRAEQRLQSLLIILDSRASLTSAGWQPGCTSAGGIVLVKYTGDREICEAIWVTRNGTLKLEFLLMRGWALPRFFPSPLRSSSFPLSCKYILKHLQFLKCIFWLFILPECTWVGCGKVLQNLCKMVFTQKYFFYFLNIFGHDPTARQLM